MAARKPNMRITSPPYACSSSSRPAARNWPHRRSRKSSFAMWDGAACRRSLTPETSNGAPNTGKCRACFPRKTTLPPAVPLRTPIIPRKPLSEVSMRGFPALALVLENRSVFLNLRRASAISSASVPRILTQTSLRLSSIPQRHPSRNTSIPKRNISILVFRTVKFAPAV